MPSRASTTSTKEVSTVMSEGRELNESSRDWGSASGQEKEREESQGEGWSGSQGDAAVEGWRCGGGVIVNKEEWSEVRLAFWVGDGEERA